MKTRIFGHKYGLRCVFPRKMRELGSQTGKTFTCCHSGVHRLAAITGSEQTTRSNVGRTRCLTAAYDSGLRGQEQTLVPSCFRYVRKLLAYILNSVYKKSPCGNHDQGTSPTSSISTNCHPSCASIDPGTYCGLSQGKLPLARATNVIANTKSSSTGPPLQQRRQHVD